MLLKYEIQKNRTVFQTALTGILLALSFALSLYQCREGLTAAYREQVRMQDELLAIRETAAYEQLYADYLARERAYESAFYASMQEDAPSRIRMENVLIDQPDYGDARLFSDVEAVIRAPAEYERMIGALLRDAAQKMRDLPDADSYSYRYNRGILLRYDKFLERELPVQAVRGWNEFFALETPTVFLLISAVCTAGGVFCRDKRAGMTPILRVCRRGDHPLTAAKLAFCLLSGVVQTALFAAGALMAAAMAYGLSSPEAPAQLLDAFSACPYWMSIGGLAAARLGVQMLTVAAVMLVSALIGQLFAHEAAAMTAGALMIGGGFTLAAIPPSHSLGWLAKFSLTEIAHGSILFEKFRGLHFFGGCVDYTAAMLLSAALVIEIACTLSLLVHPTARMPVKARERRTGRGSVRMPLAAWEAWKQLVCRKGAILLAAAVLVKLAVSYAYYSAPLDADELVYRDYIARVEGPVTAETLDYIEREGEYIAQALADYPAARTAWRQGEMSAEEFTLYENRYNYAKYAERGYQMLSARRDYLVSASDAHPEVMFVWEEGAMRWLEAPADVTLLFTLIFLVSGSFAMEYDDGFASILRLTRHGRRSVFWAKLSFALLLASALCVLFTGMDAWMLARFYPIDCAGVSLHSLPRFAEFPAEMTIGGYLILQTLVTRMGFLALVIFAAAVSVLAGGSIRAMTLTGMIAALPPLMETAGISLLAPVSFVRFCTMADISAGCPTALICTAASVTALASAYRKWNGKGIRIRG